MHAARTPNNLTIFSSPPIESIAHNTDDALTYGSVVKLQHGESKYFLHSHQINWGSGSGQQSVTCESRAIAFIRRPIPQPC